MEMNIGDLIVYEDKTKFPLFVTEKIKVVCFEMVDEKKVTNFWEIFEKNETETVERFGKKGTEGQAQEKTHDSNKDMISYIKKSIKEKENEKFVNVTSSESFIYTTKDAAGTEGWISNIDLELFFTNEKASLQKKH